MRGCEHIKLEGSDLDVWIININTFSKEYIEYLSEEELERYFSYKNKRRQKLFCISSYMLRSLSSLYLDINSCDIVIDRKCENCEKQHGKPILLNCKNLHFSVSYSYDKVVIGFSRFCEIGIDIERIDIQNNYKDYFDTVLTQSEKVDILRKSESNQNKEFIKYWTLKESILKCYGDGLAIDVKDIELETLNKKINAKKLPQNYKNIFLKSYYLDSNEFLSIATKERLNTPRIKYIYNPKISDIIAIY